MCEIIPIHAYIANAIATTINATTLNVGGMRTLSMSHVFASLRVLNRQCQSAYR